MKINKSLSFIKRTNFATITLLSVSILLAGCTKQIQSERMKNSENYEKKSKDIKEPQIDISEHKLNEPWGITIQSENLIIRNIENGTFAPGEKEKSDLDYYFRLFSDKIIMEKYMNGVPRPAKEIISRHQKYFSCWCSGNPFSSYLTFLNEGASIKFISDQKNLLESYNPILQTVEKEISHLHNVLREPLVSLKHFINEFENSGKIFIGHVMLEPGDDRGLNTDA